MFATDIFERLLTKNRSFDCAASNFEYDNYDDEVDISTIGPLLWSKEHFVSNVRLKSQGSDEDSDDGSEGPTKSCRNKIGTETKDSDDVHPSFSNIEDLDGGQRRKRKSAAVRMTANEVCQELGKANVSPHLLIAPHIYGESFGAGAAALQPFQITVHPQVGFLSDLHGHLCDAEVIGLLAGKWDSESKMLYVQAAFPCASTERREDDGSTDVELDPVAELAVREIISGLGLIVVGWYHSHPQFRPDPSVTDIHNQQQYQTLMKDEISGLEPFIGLIVSTFDVKLPSNESLHQWFHTRPYSDGSRGKKVTSIPMLLDVQIGLFADEYRDAEAYLTDEQTQQLSDILQGLSTNSPETIEESLPVVAVSGRGIESNEDDVVDVEVDDIKYLDSDDSAEDCESPYGIYTDSAPTYPVQVEHTAYTEYKEQIPYHFAASGGHDYLGDSPADVSEVIDVSTPEVKKKQNNKKPPPPIVEGGDRKSGRETRAPVMYVPEKEKKEVIKPPIDAASLTLSDGLSGAPATSVKTTKKISKINGVKSKKKKSKSEGLSHIVVSDVHFEVSKSSVGKAVGGIDKWLLAGAVEVPLTMSPLAKKKKKTQIKTLTQTNIKTNTKILSKSKLKIPDVEPSFLPIPNEVEVKEEVRRRHGPGARGGIKSTFLAFQNRAPNQSSTSVKSGIESPQSSSTVLGKRKKQLKVEQGSEKRQILKMKLSSLIDGAVDKKTVVSVVGKKGKGKSKGKGSGKIEMMPKVVHSKNCMSSGDTNRSVIGRRAVNEVSKEKKAEKEKEKDTEIEADTDTEVFSLLHRLQGQSCASTQGRMLLCSVKPLYRCLLLGVVSLGLYYSTHPRKTNLSSTWRDSTLKLDKLRESVSHWAVRLCLSPTCQKTLVTDIVIFILSCWAEGDENVRVVPSTTQKKKRSTAAPDELCVHTSRDGKHSLYKEDDGRDDEPKKKKKKKTVKI